MHLGAIHQPVVPCILYIHVYCKRFIKQIGVAILCTPKHSVVNLAGFLTVCIQFTVLAFVLMNVNISSNY